MHTERLYYEDVYLREFTAHVVARRLVDGRFCVAPDRSAFYPTGGGQPHDLGTLGGVPVIDVVSEDDAVWIVLAHELGRDEGAEVQGLLDWPRRSGPHATAHRAAHPIRGGYPGAIGGYRGVSPGCRGQHHRRGPQ